MEKVRDMTKGNPTGHIIAFALPMLLGNVFQQMYSLVDTAVVGNVCGVEAMAAVGSAGWLDWLVLGFVIGMTQGFSILISQRFGAGDMQGMRRAVSMSMYLTLASIVVVTTVSVLMCRTVFRWMNTPEESYELACNYAQIIFMGIPVTMSYNLFAGMLRALGDSRTPLIAMVIAALTNIVLDLLFVAQFGMGVQGAALATVSGQLLSAVFCLIAVLRVKAFKLTREDWRIDKGTVLKLLKLGLPIAGQTTIVYTGGVIMQSIINGFGVIVMAGISAANKLAGLFEMAGLSIGSAMHTFAGQNLGAGRYDRIREGVKKAVGISVLLAIVFGAAGLIFGRPLLSLFVDMNSPDAGKVIDAAYQFFSIVCVMLSFAHALYIFRSTLQGMGVVVLTIASSFLQVFMRTVATYLMTLVIAEKGVYIGDTLAWSSAAVFLMIVYFCHINKLDPRKRRNAQ